MKTFSFFSLMIFLILPSLSSHANSAATQTVSTELPKVESYQEGAKVLVVFSPTCGFCRAAFEQFDQEIWKELKAKGLFVVPVNENTAEMAQQVQEYIKGKYDINPHLVPRSPGLAGIEAEDLRSVPRFLFLKDGKVVKRVVGWPRDGSHAKDLREGFKLL
jgi:thiol-disulfide isomerase/thioredoxin